MFYLYKIQRRYNSLSLYFINFTILKDLNKKGKKKKKKQVLFLVDEPVKFLLESLTCLFKVKF